MQLVVCSRIDLKAEFWGAAAAVQAVQKDKTVHAIAIPVQLFQLKSDQTAEQVRSFQQKATVGVGQSV